MNKQEVKTALTIIVLMLAVLQGPILYYFTSGFIKLILLIPICIIGFLLTIILAVKVFKDKSTTTKYHIAGLVFAIVAGISSTFLRRGMEYMDFRLKMSERLEIIDQIKKGTLKSTHLADEILQVSNGGNDINFYKHPDGTVHVEFYIDRGFIDHASVFLYTNNQSEIWSMDDKIKNNDSGTVIIKLAKNWYREGY